MDRAIADQNEQKLMDSCGTIIDAYLQNLAMTNDDKKFFGTCEGDVESLSFVNKSTVESLVVRKEALR